MAALPTEPAGPHPIHHMVDALAERAAVTVDSRLRTLLYRAGCALLDHALRDGAGRRVFADTCGFEQLRGGSSGG